MKAHETHERTRRWTSGFSALPLSCLFVCFVGSSLADTHYVAVSNATPFGTYTSWAWAATNIQDAITAASPGDTVLVSNGVYEVGYAYYPMFFSLRSRVAIYKAITVRSVNGPAVTCIKGQPLDIDPIVRGVYVGTNACLSGFTVTNGGTLPGGDLKYEMSAGGVLCESNSVVSNCRIYGNTARCYGGGAYGGTFSNCLLSGNSAVSYGGGAYQATLNNCVLSYNSAGIVDGGGAYNCRLNNCALMGNTAAHGGGAANSVLVNCTLTGNSANDCGGTWGADLTNCIVYYNTASRNPNYWLDRMSYCCSTPQPPGIGNISDEPGLASATHLATNSPCVGRGRAGGILEADIDGEAWRSPPSIGADEPRGPSATGELSVAISARYTQVTPGFEAPFIALIEGRVTRSAWDFGDGSSATNRPYVTHSWAATGSYAVVLTAWNADHPVGASYTTVVSVAWATYYVNSSNATPSYPYTNSATAATNIQQAISASSRGGRLVLVTNGLYRWGGTPSYAGITNRVMLTNGVTVRSVNGPQVTIIKGKGPSGADAVRCAYVGSDCVLSGFTLTNGATLVSGQWQETDGGGVWSEPGGLTSNCWILGNAASYAGGGARAGTLWNCTLTGNTASERGGGSEGSTLYNCTITRNSAKFAAGMNAGTLSHCSVIHNSATGSGGGVQWCTVDDCALISNSAGYGAGAMVGTLNNCLLFGNVSTNAGGGAEGAELNNCTVSGNSAGNNGGGVWGGTLRNCIVYGNSATSSAVANWVALDSNSMYSCTTPLAPGMGNITNNPRFVDVAGANYHLGASSLCIDRGVNESWMDGATDLEGNRRIINGTVDMGCYETPYYLTLKVWLQGPYSTNEHRMSTNLMSVMPLTAPYAADHRTAASVPSNVMDWALLQLRAGATGKTVVSRSVFLKRGGYLAADTGTNVITLDISASNYYVIVQHRNHLPAMSAAAVPFTNNFVTYDFTTNWTQFYDGTNGCVRIDSNMWGMIAGDADGDGKITAADQAICSNEVGKTGYLSSDFNLDGTVNE